MTTAKRRTLAMIQLGALGLCGALAATACDPAPTTERELPAAAEAATEAPPTPDLVVDLDDHMTRAEIAQFARRYHAHLVETTSFSRRDHMFRLLPTPEFQSLGRGQLIELLRALRQDPHVEAADFALTYQIPETAPTALTRAADEALPARTPEQGEQGDKGAQGIAPTDEQRGRFVPNDPKYRYQWHLDQIRMPHAWAYSRGEGVTVAVVDTGVTPVEDLQGTELVPGWNFVDDSPDARDDHGHGTHVAGTIAQTTHNGVGVAGVAYRARIMPIKVLSGSGSGSVNGIAQGIRWATDHGAQVINMSLGGPFNSQVLAKAVRYAHDHGVVVVCAAGNDGRGKVSFPAANAGAIAVAATQYDEATTFYSNWGREIFIAAPGGNTRVDQNNDGLPDGVLQNTVTPGNISKQDYLLFMGTSMASPHIAGVAALIVGQGVRNPEQVAELLQQTARRPAQYRGKHDNHYGAGIVDAAAAVEAAHRLLARRGALAPIPQLRPLADECPAHEPASGGRFGMLGLLALGAGGLGLMIRRRRGAVVRVSGSSIDEAGTL